MRLSAPPAAAPALSPAVAPTPSPTPAPQPESPAAVAPLASRAAWDRTEVRMKQGEVQRVAVNLFGARSLQEVSISVRSDTPGIEFVEIGAGQLLSVDGASVLTERQMEGTRASAQFKRATPLSGGTGTVAFVAFRATRQGEATIFVEALSLRSGEVLSQVPLAGAVRVTVEP